MPMDFPSATGNNAENAQESATGKDNVNVKNFREMKNKTNESKEMRGYRINLGTAKGYTDLIRNAYMADCLKRLTAWAETGTDGKAVYHIIVRCEHGDYATGIYEEYEFDLPLNEETTDFIVNILVDDDECPIPEVHDFTAGDEDDIEYSIHEAGLYA